MAKSVKKQVYKIQDSLASPQKDVLSKENNNIKNSSTLINFENNKLDNDPLPIRLTNQNLLEAVIYSEILGKPRCKRRDRWR